VRIAARPEHAVDPDAVAAHLPDEIGDLRRGGDYGPPARGSLVGARECRKGYKNETCEHQDAHLAILLRTILSGAMPRAIGAMLVVAGVATLVQALA
jgi:hypothetical protein